MDHTLLQENGQLDQFTTDVIQQAPLQVSLASARNPYSMVDFVQTLHLTGPQLAMNGAIIFKVIDGQLQVLEKRTIDKQVSLRVRQFLHDHFPQVDFTWITSDHWYIPTMTPEMEFEIQYSNVQPIIGESLENTTPPCQIVLVIKDEVLFKQVQTELRKAFAHDHLSVRGSGDGYLTINAVGTSKGLLVDYLVDQGVDRQSIIGVGDDQNDVPLLEAVGHSLAVANAASNIKALVDEVIPSNVDDGIAKYLQQFSN